MKRAPMDPRPSLTVHTVPERRLSFLRELPMARVVMREVKPDAVLSRDVVAETEFERWPGSKRLGALAGMTLAVCLAICAVVFSFQLLGGR